jgi:glycosyltransferase involved in cell wall biosynthesis
VSRDLSKNGVSPKKLTTIYKGHDLSWYAGSHTLTADRQIRNVFKIPAEATIVGMVANMRRVKGADVLIRAMEYLPANIHAVLIGEVRDPQIPRLVTDLGLEKRVHFTGYRHDAPYLLPAFHINVAPSRGREGLTRTVIEGMAQGIPAVATTAGGLPELVADGETGFIVPPDDPVQLASRLCYLAEHPTVHQKMARASKERIASRFDVSQTVSLTAACYRTLLETQ